MMVVNIVRSFGNSVVRGTLHTGKVNTDGDSTVKDIQTNLQYLAGRPCTNTVRYAEPQATTIRNQQTEQ